MLTRHVEGRRILVELGQLVFLVRVIGLALCVYLGAVDGWPMIVATIVLCVIAVSGTFFLHPVQRVVDSHPVIMTVDVVACAFVVHAAEADLAILLLVLTCPVLIGVLHDRRPSLLNMALFLAAVALAVVTSGGRVPAADAAVVFSAYLAAYGAAVLVRARILSMSEEALSARRALVASEERARLARDMHDGVVKTLHGLALTAQALRRHQEVPPALHGMLNSFVDAAHLGAEQARETLVDLRREQDDRPLTVVSREIVDRWSARTGVSAEFRAQGGVDVDDDPRACVLACLREALDNVAEHAHAAHVRVALTATRRNVQLEVVDDGRGVGDHDLVAARRRGHYGVQGMQERALVVNGRFELSSTPGAGASARLVVPHPTPRTES